MKTTPATTSPNPTSSNSRKRRSLSKAATWPSIVAQPPPLQRKWPSDGKWTRPSGLANDTFLFSLHFWKKIPMQIYYFSLWVEESLSLLTLHTHVHVSFVKKNQIIELVIDYTCCPPSALTSGLALRELIRRKVACLTGPIPSMVRVARWLLNSTCTTWPTRMPENTNA